MHPKGWDDVPQNAPKMSKNPRPKRACSTWRISKRRQGGRGQAERQERAARPVTFLYNGGPGSSTVWLHMGAFGPRRVVTADDTHTPAAPYPAGQQRLQPARRQRPGVCRCARHGLQPHRRQGQREGVLRRGCGRACVCRFHRAVSVEIRPLEFAQIPVWRELRHHACRRCCRTCSRPSATWTSTA